MPKANECPVCGKPVEIVEMPDDPSKLAGYCAHWPGALPRCVIVLPNPDYKAPEPEPPVKKSKKKE
jgi:hypothetical protein